MIYDEYMKDSITIDAVQCISPFCYSELIFLGHEHFPHFIINIWSVFTK